MKQCYLFLLLFFIIGYILPLGFRPMIAPDEYRYAEVPREMIERNNYVVPYLAGTRYFEKPALGYQMTALSFKIFGVNEFALRLPPALSVGGAVLLLIWLMRRMQRDDGLAALAGGIFMATGLVYGLGVFTVLDSQLNLFLTGTLICYYLGIQELKFSRRKFILLALSGIFAGCAFLTKGFLAFAVPGITILAYLIWQKRWSDIWKTPWIPLFFCIAVALPWSLEIHKQEPDYWRYFFWEEHIQRMFNSDGGQHPQPIWFFVPIIIGCLAPALFIVPMAIKGFTGRWKSLVKDDFLSFLCCYLIFPFCFFSLSSGKLATYILPCYVPLAGLLAVGLRRYLRDANMELFNKIVHVVSIVLAIAASLFSGWQIFAPVKLRLYTADEMWSWIFAMVAVLILCVMLQVAKYHKQNSWKLPLILGGMLPLLVAGNNALPCVVAERKSYGEALEYLKKEAMVGESIIATHITLAHALAYTYKIDDIRLLFHGGEMDYGLSYPDAAGRLLNAAEFKALIEQKDRPPVVMLTRKNNDHNLAPDTPEPDFKIDYKTIFLRRWN